MRAQAEPEFAIGFGSAVLAMIFGNPSPLKPTVKKDEKEHMRSEEFQEVEEAERRANHLITSLLFD